MKSFCSNKRGDAYIFIVFFVALAFFALIWFMFFSSDGFVVRVINATTPIHTSLGSDTHASYAGMTGFIDVLLNGFLVATVIVLMIGGIVYVQRRRAEGYM